MTNVTTEKRCNACRQVKPTSEFYKHGKNSFHSECKDCARLRNKRRVRIDRKVSSIPTEADVIHELNVRGIPALPGKSLNHQYADIIAWGCALIEVKSTEWNGYSYRFNFTNQHNKNRIRGHMIVLVCCNEGRQTYHVFDAQHPAFYRDGKIRNHVEYIPVRKQKPKTTAVMLTKDMMDDAKDRWTMIEYWRLKLSNELRQTALPIAA